MEELLKEEKIIEVDIQDGGYIFKINGIEIKESPEFKHQNGKTGSKTPPGPLSSNEKMDLNLLDTLRVNCTVSKCVE